MADKSASYGGVLARKSREAAEVSNPRARAELHLRIARFAAETGHVLDMERHLKEARYTLGKESALLAHALAGGAMDSKLREERKKEQDWVYSRQVAVDRLLGLVRDMQSIDCWDNVYVDVLPETLDIIRLKSRTPKTKAEQDPFSLLRARPKHRTF